MEKEGRKQRGGHLSGEECGVPRAERRDPQVNISQRVEVSTGSGVCTEGE